MLTIVHMQDGTEDVYQAGCFVVRDNERCVVVYSIPRKVWVELPDYHVLPTEGGAK